MAAGSMAKASSQEPVGKKPLWRSKTGEHLPAYIQHVANDLKAEHGESKAIQMAIGIIKNWASGRPSGGEKGIQQSTVAAARKALAEWEALKARHSGGKGKK